jgi:hypothetical protein
VQIDGVGELLQWGELWLLIYDGCRHEFYFPRYEMNYERDHVEAEVRTYYRTCQRCARPRPSAAD